MRVLPQANIMPGGSSNVIVRTEVLAAAGGWDSRLTIWPTGICGCVSPSRVLPLAWHVRSLDIASIQEMPLPIRISYCARLGSSMVVRRRLDYAALHHYLAWVHLRNGRRRPAVTHFIHAAVRGDVLEVAGLLVALTNGRIHRIVSMLRPQPSRLDREWIAEAEESDLTLERRRCPKGRSAAGAES